MDSQGLIVVFRNGYYISMAVAVIGFAFSVFLFMKYDIRTIWQIKTGRAERQRVRDLENASRNEGRMLREEKHGHLSSEELVGEAAPGTEKLKPRKQREGTSDLADGALSKQTGPVPTTLLTQNPAGANETTLLNPEPRRAQTTVLGGQETARRGDFGGTADLGYGPTSDLSLQGTSATTVLPLEEQPELNQGFCITQEVVLIHTDEWIPLEG